MKTLAGNISKSTLAQIKPLRTTGFLFQTILRHIWITQTLIILFFFSTSYVNEENAMYDLGKEFYSAEMYQAISMVLQSDSQSTISEHLQLKTERFVRELYRENHFNALWTLNRNLNNSAGQLLEMIGNAACYGLDKSLYRYDQLTMLLNNLQNVNRTDSFLILRSEFELLLTDACLLLSVHLSRGLIALDTCNEEKSAKVLSDFVYAGIRHNDLDKRILSLQPQNSYYVNLQKALENFVKKNEINDLSFNIPDVKKDSVTSLDIAKKALIHLGYLISDTVVTDSVYQAALMNFQLHHGLKPDAKLSENTRKALSMSNRERFLRASLTLDKLRKDRQFGSDYILVNIPSFQLKVFRDKKIDKTYNVVVGRPSTPTPELSSRLETIVTAPEWNVPKTITMNELLPLVKKDSTYLIRNNFRLIDDRLNPVDINTVSWKDMNNENFNYYFIQNSGNSNALGLLKFSFKNPYRVYIHDTPSKRYFSHDIRAYSHGCIRLQNPDQLAMYLVDNNLKAEQKPDIVSLIEKRVKQDIALSDPIDLHIRYLTCEADENLNLYFYKDIYNKDSKLIHSLFN